MGGFLFKRWIAIKKKLTDIGLAFLGYGRLDTGKNGLSYWMDNG